MARSLEDQAEELANELDKPSDDWPEELEQGYVAWLLRKLAQKCREADVR